MNAGVVAADTSANAVQDKIYTSGKNNSGAALSAGDVVCLDTTAADGISFTTPAAANVGSVLGVLEEDVAIGAYTNKIVRRGVVNALHLGHANTVVGSTLKLVAGQKYLTLSNAAYTPGDSQPNFTSLVAWTTTSAALKSVFVQC